MILLPESGSVLDRMNAAKVNQQRHPKHCELNIVNFGAGPGKPMKYLDER
jgi:hypothetical protein